MKLKFLNFAVLAALTTPAVSQAIPRIYDCKIIDYTPQLNPAETHFSFNPSRTAVSTESNQSLVQLSMDGNQILHLEIRPRSEPTTYAMAYAEDFPHHLSVTYVLKEIAGTLTCNLN
jgi:hypothetical protein